MRRREEIELGVDAEAPGPTGRGKRALRLAATALLAAGALGLVLLGAYGPAGDLRANLFGPAWSLVHGLSPYLPDQAFGCNPPRWFPQSVGLFFPLGWLEPQQVAVAWSAGTLALAGFFLARFRERGSEPLLAAAAVLFFPPLIVHFIYGQFALVAVATSVLSARWVVQRRFGWAGLALAISAAKPQLCVLFVPGLLLVAGRRGGLRDALRLVAATIAATALLTLPLWVAFPGWFHDFVSAQRSNPSWLQPTLLTALSSSLGIVGRALAVLALLTALSANFWLWWRYPAEEALPWSLALTSLSTPYLWTWDMVLILPIVIRSITRQTSGRARMGWVLGSLVSWAIAAAVYAAFGGDHRYMVWIPGFFLLLAVMGHRLHCLGTGVREPLLRG